ncbi:MAG: aldehyde dehydrogenase family protein [Acidimicrobiia bacterium]
MDADLRSIAQARDCVERASIAFDQFRGASQEDIDRIVETMSRAAAREAGRLGSLAVEETGHGNAADKRMKNLFNALSVAEWLRHVRTVGVLWKDERTKVMAVAEPMGVVAALIPVTNPTATVIFKVLSAVKAGNAIVCAPHPRGVRSGVETTAVLAAAADEAGAPPNLIQCLSEVTLDGTSELMRHRRTSVVMATGGSDMVRAAYSCGKPTLAVGPGNVPVFVDASKRHDLEEVADQILTSKAFDYGTACVAEQAVVAHREIARPLRDAISTKGGYFCTPSEAQALAAVMFEPNGRQVPNHVAQPASRLAEMAGFDVPPRTRVLVAEASEIGRQVPLSREKLNPVLAYYEAGSHDDAYRLCEAVLAFGGIGHSAAVHTNDARVKAQFSMLPVGRLLINTPCALGGMGYSTDLEPSFMLGTGTWSGSIVSDNVTALHLINIKRIAEETRPWRSFSEIERKAP